MGQLHKKWWIWAALFVFQVAFAYYYDYTEFQRGHYFNPFMSSQEYYQTQILGAWNTASPEGDLQAYNRQAYSLLTFHKIVNPNGEASAWVTPGYSMALAVLYGIFGYRFLPVVLFNALCLVGAYFFLCRMTERLGRARAATVAFVLLAINLRASMFVGYIYTECFCFLLFFAAVDLLEEGRRPLLAALLYGLSILVRPVMFGAWPVLMILNYLRNGKKLSQTVIVAVLSLSFLGAWVGRNFVTLGFPLISTSSAYAFAEGNQDFYKKFRFWDSYHSSFNQQPYGKTELSPDLSSKIGANEELKKSMEVKQGFENWRQQNKSFYLWLCAWRFKNLLSPYTFDMSRRNKAISLLLWLLIFPTSFYYFLKQGLRNPRTLLFALALFILSLPALTVIGNSLRYQVPAELLLTSLTSLFLRIIQSRGRTPL